LYREEILSNATSAKIDVHMIKREIFQSIVILSWMRFGSKLVDMRHLKRIFQFP